MLLQCFFITYNNSPYWISWRPQRAIDISTTSALAHRYVFFSFAPLSARSAMTIGGHGIHFLRGAKQNLMCSQKWVLTHWFVSSIFLRMWSFLCCLSQRDDEKYTKNIKWICKFEPLFPLAMRFVDADPLCARVQKKFVTKKRGCDACIGDAILNAWTDGRTVLPQNSQSLTKNVCTNNNKFHCHSYKLSIVRGYENKLRISAKNMRDWGS